MKFTKKLHNLQNIVYQIQESQYQHLFLVSMPVSTQNCQNKQLDWQTEKTNSTSNAKNIKERSNKTAAKEDEVKHKVK